MNMDEQVSLKYNIEYIEFMPKNGSADHMGDRLLTFEGDSVFFVTVSICTATRTEYVFSSLSSRPAFVFLFVCLF